MVTSKLTEVSKTNNHTLQSLRKEDDDLRSKRKEIKEKQDIVLKKTQVLIENQAMQY